MIVPDWDYLINPVLLQLRSCSTMGPELQHHLNFPLAFRLTQNIPLSQFSLHTVRLPHQLARTLTLINERVRC
ncbi:hypothetical protein J6590_008957 [Homalodisca vitripennis]|nr:hypothetical protein J6590_008957 [Homalodisca vitripennis]